MNFKALVQEIVAKYSGRIDFKELEGDDENWAEVSAFVSPCPGGHQLLVDNISYKGDTLQECWAHTWAALALGN